MYNSDGDFLIVPQQRTLWIQTELGRMTVMPGEFCIIPRGVVFTVNIMKHSKADEEQVGGSDVSSLFARGYILEIFRGHFQLPELGPIGSNGLANARDFLHPKAYYESNKSVANRACTIVNKFGQHLFARLNPHSPYNVVAWHGNYLPCKYDLRRFCAINSVTYDHLDPSINTVLTAKGGDEDGTALADFVVFIPRVMATGTCEHSDSMVVSIMSNR
jgi:homogentisate 1,2-dioxygenase